MRSLTLSSFPRSISCIRSLVSNRQFACTPVSRNGHYIGKLEASLKAILTSRPIETTISYLDPTSSHLLNLTLADFLPELRPQLPVNSSAASKFRHLDQLREEPLPQGHHLVYFPPEVLNSQLLEDGTDDLHSPGAPFIRRMWAGGSVIFHPSERRQLRYANGWSHCLEDIQDVSIKGIEGDEKVFVTVRRRMQRKVPYSENLTGLGQHGMGEVRDAETSQPQSSSNGNCTGEWAVIEFKKLVFMREKSVEEVKKDVQKQQRVVKPHLIADISVSIKPTPNLLFRWSALTFNAHRIHLDPKYCQEVEGHRNMLIHGPLSLFLMISVLKSHLLPGEMVMRLDYRNLAPLYVNEGMQICLKEHVKRNTKDGKRDLGNISPANQRKFDVWIEGQGGGYAVKGTAVVGPKERDSG